MNKEKVRIISREIYSKYGLSIPVDLHFLLEQMRIDIRICKLPGNIAGMTVPVKKKLANGLILLNEGLSRGRARFTVAHEIYHILKHSQKSYFSLMNNESLSVYERECDIFAAELLMPKKEIYNAYYQQKTQTVEELALLFDVSRKAMEIRLKELGILE